MKIKYLLLLLVSLATTAIAFEKVVHLETRTPARTNYTLDQNDTTEAALLWLTAKGVPTKDKKITVYFTQEYAHFEKQMVISIEEK